MKKLSLLFSLIFSIPLLSQPSDSLWIEKQGGGWIFVRNTDSVQKNVTERSKVAVSNEGILDSLLSINESIELTLVDGLRKTVREKDANRVCRQVGIAVNKVADKPIEEILWDSLVNRFSGRWAVLVSGQVRYIDVDKDTRKIKEVEGLDSDKEVTGKIAISGTFIPLTAFSFRVDGLVGWHDRDTRFVNLSDSSVMFYGYKTDIIFQKIVR